MLDAHRLNQLEQSALWYDDVYPEEEVIRLWDQLMIRFSTKWNLFAVDLHNEPHYPVSWGNNNTKTDFNLYAERFIAVLYQ
jgi:endoglucanase